MASASDLLRIENLDVSFSVFGDKLRIVRNAGLRILPGKVTALVGESGSGKSVISQSIMGILPTPAKATGKILFTDPLDGKTTDILQYGRDSEEMRDLRGKRMATIFQEPMTSLSPLHTVGNQISESLLIHTDADKKLAREKTEEMLGLVGFANPKRTYDMYPFELSGGMRQRAMIAMALICRPALLIADEPTTALDVTIQAQILDLLMSLQRERGMALVLITHNMGVVSETAQRVAVMYSGQVVETNATSRLFAEPQHPYTAALLAARPESRIGDRLATIPGSVPSLYERPAGCLFAPRCTYATPRCFADRPELRDWPIGGGVRCHYPLGDPDRDAKIAADRAQVRVTA